jgi:hypothetical protein
VVIYYNGEAGQETVNLLETLVEGYEDRVLLTPLPEMENTITLTAWGRMDSLSYFDEERIKEFIRAFRGIDHH